MPKPPMAIDIAQPQILRGVYPESHRRAQDDKLWGTRDAWPCADGMTEHRRGLW